MPDALGRPTQLGSYASAIAYAANGQPNALSYGNGGDVTWNYTTRGLLSRTWYGIGSLTLASRRLTWDANGNLGQITDSAQPGTDAESFSYDQLDRLTTLVSDRYGTDSYSYDPLGNVRSATAFGSFQYNVKNRMVQRDNGRVHDPYSYDTRGNLVSGNGRTLNWNLANELASDSTGNVFTYDAWGWRVKRTATAAASYDGSAHTRYDIYGRDHLLQAERDNGVWVDFVHLGTQPIARIDGTTVSYILPNYQGSPLFETGNAGTVTRAPDYLGYGRTTPAWQSVIPAYTGAASDAVTGETYLGARYLFHQRFTSPDRAPLIRPARWG